MKFGRFGINLPHVSTTIFSASLTISGNGSKSLAKNLSACQEGLLVAITRRAAELSQAVQLPPLAVVNQHQPPADY
ncbi:MAG: hypothetical protein K8T91_16345 [Planctomycetes bacterium]|nr:hypothetical protein [Planctomycetota bacterium]